MTTSIIFKIIIAELTFFFRKNIKIILEDKGLFHVYNTPNLDKVKPNEVMPIMQNTIGKVTDKLVDTSKILLVLQLVLLLRLFMQLVLVGR
ncbi:hypothetical protein [Clostridium sp. KNHs214]|uniref:hypothetical protein n=1 Tax=Clostridium sp. KNHs214 TaxID=1540257 RepID=UPI00054D79F8|nr:hypothetical protein [Clostridium sp. KNHs214]